MTTLTAADAAPTPRTSGPRLTFPRVARAEWIKAATVRSTYWMIGGTLAFVLVFAAGVLSLVAFAPTADVPDPAGVITDNYGATPSIGVLEFAFMFAYALVAVFGVLLVGPERSTGLLSATLAAAPRRTSVYAAKLLVSAVVGAAIGIVGAVASFLIAQPVLGTYGLGSSLADPEVVNVLVGGAIFLGLIAALSTALGSIFRGTAPALGAVLGLLLVAPGILPIIPGIGGEIAGFLPSAAGMMLVQSAAQVGWQPILTGGLVLLGWTVAATVLGGVLFTRRDV